jgi:hypothetical protein
MLCRNGGTTFASFVIYKIVADRTISTAVAAETLFSATTFFLKLIAPPPSAKRAGEESSDSLAKQPEASLQARDSSMHAVRRSKRIENKNLPAGLPQNAVRRSKRITKLPAGQPKHVHVVPAVPIQIENKYLAERRSNRITKLPVRFAT